MGSRERSPIDSKRLVGKVLIENLPKRAIAHTDIRDWLRKYGNISEIIIYPRCLLVQFDSDLEAAGAVQCENGAQLYGTKVSLKHVELNDLRALRRNGPPIDRFSSDPLRYCSGRVDREKERERERGHGSIHRERYRGRSSSSERKRRPEDSVYRRSKSPVFRFDSFSKLLIYGRSDRRIVHPVNWLSDLPDKEKDPTNTVYHREPGTDNQVSKSFVRKSHSKSPYTVAIIAVQHDLVPYAEIIKQRITNIISDPNTQSGSPPLIHIMVLLSTDHLNPCLADLTENGVPFAIICTMTNWTHGSCTLRILYVPTQQEHRNMPLEDALLLLQNEYATFSSSNKSEDDVTNSEDNTFLPPTRHLVTLLRMLADSRVLSIGELDEIELYIQERKRRLNSRRGIGNGATTGSENTAELKTRILSMLYPQSTSTAAPSGVPAPVPVPNSSHSAASITAKNIGDKLAEKLNNPIVQKAIDTLMSFPPSSVSQVSNVNTLQGNFVRNDSFGSSVQNSLQKTFIRSNLTNVTSSVIPSSSESSRQPATWNYDDSYSFQNDRTQTASDACLMGTPIPYHKMVANQAHEYIGINKDHESMNVNKRGILSIPDRDRRNNSFQKPDAGIAHQDELSGNKLKATDKTHYNAGLPRRRRRKSGGKVISGGSYQYLSPQNYSQNQGERLSQLDMMSSEVRPVGSMTDGYNYPQGVSTTPLLFESGNRVRPTHKPVGGNSFNSFNYPSSLPQQNVNMNAYPPPYGYQPQPFY